MLTLYFFGFLATVIFGVFCMVDAGDTDNPWFINGARILLLSPLWCFWAPPLLLYKLILAARLDELIKWRS